MKGRKAIYSISTVNGAEQQTKTIKAAKKEKETLVNEADGKQINFDEKTKEKIDISEEEFEKLYKEYLTKNNVKDEKFIKTVFSIPYNIIAKN